MNQEIEIGWDSSVGLAMAYRLDGWGSIPGRSRDFVSALQYPAQFLGPPSLLVSGYQRFGGAEHVPPNAGICLQAHI
jgi:hypothetical protein